MSTVRVISTSASRRLEARHLLNIVALVAVVVINTLANTLPLNGISTGEISDSYPSLFTPAGYVFSIWGLIYLLLAVFVVYQALPAHRGNPRLERLGYLFVVSCALNIGWLFAWHYLQIPLSLLLMLGLLATLILSYERLRIGRSEVSRGERWGVRLAFSVYLGWITVATVANASVVLLELGVRPGWTAPFWALVAIVAATLVGLSVLKRRHDAAFVLVLVWAFLGIAARQWGNDALLVLAAAAAAVYLAYAAVQHSRSADTLTS
jgi:translocator protein